MFFSNCLTIEKPVEQSPLLKGVNLGEAAVSLQDFENLATQSYKKLLSNLKYEAAAANCSLGFAIKP